MTTPSTTHQPKRLPWNRHLDAIHRIQAVYQPHHKQYPLHDHEFIEVVVLVRGTALHRSATGDREIGRGDCFLLRPGAWHGYERCHNLSLYNCCFATTALAQELAWASDDAALRRLLWTLPLAPANHGMVALHLRANDIAATSSLLDKLCHLHTQDGFSYRADSVGLLCQILAALSRALPAEPPTEQPRACSTSIRAVLKLIDGDPAYGWTLKELADRSGVAASHLARRFRAFAGLPPMAYPNRRRLDRAASYLIDTTEPIGVISNRVGWPDANYFSRKFKKQFGVSPSEYRDRYQRLSSE